LFLSGCADGCHCGRLGDRRGEALLPRRARRDGAARRSGRDLAAGDTVRCLLRLHDGPRQRPDDAHSGRGDGGREGSRRLSRTCLLRAGRGRDAQGGARRALGRVTLQAYRGRARALHVLSGVPPPARAGPHDGRRLRRRWADLGHLGPGTRRGPLRLRSQRSRTAEAPRPARERRAEASRASLTGSSRDRR
jgi:hypothetical protein